MRRSALAWALAGALALLTVSPGIAREPDEGVSVGRGSIVRHAYPASLLESSAAQQFTALKQQASQKGALLPPNHPLNLRLRRIARDMLPFAEKWNPRAKQWKWEVVTIQSNNINAFCMPGGKIAFFTGIIERLQLTEDEIAIVMGHEMAHALREHARARAVKSTLTNLTGCVVGSLIFGQAGEAVGAGAANLFTLRFSRGDETDADLVGLELAARAGYNPASGISLWEKMRTAAKGAPPQWLSTHPANETRIKTIKDSLPEVEPIYERARAAKASTGRPTPGAERPLGAPPGRSEPRPSAPPAPAGPSGGFPNQVPLPVPR
jgi:predicted Zn-dependent protease